MKKEKYLIFIVEDDDVFREMLVDELSENKLLEIFSFSTGEKCLSQLEQNPDIIILDHYLNKADPEAKSGMEIIDEFQKSSPESKIIILSHALSDVMFEYLMKKDVYSYIVKGEDAFQELKNQIDEIIFAL